MEKPEEKGPGVAESGWFDQVLRIIGLISFALLMGITISVFAVGVVSLPPLTGLALPSIDERLFLWFLILPSGILGGLVFSAREGKVTLPHPDPKNPTLWIPGIVGDAVAGIAGSVVIFLVMPFDPPRGEPIDMDQFVLIKIVALAIVGGYGGRVLVEKVLAEKIRDIEEKVDTVQTKERQDAKALELLDQQLDLDPDQATEVTKEQLVEAMKGTSASFHSLALERARGFRRDAIEQGLGQLRRVYPVFEALITTGDEKQRHHHHAEIAYALKSRAENLSPVDKLEERKSLFRKAEESLDAAIRARDKQNVPGYKIYEFVRAIVRIHLAADTGDAGTDSDDQRIFEDLRIAYDGGGKLKSWIEVPDPERDKPLRDWLIAHQSHPGGIGTWIKSHVKQLPPQASDDSTSTGNST